MAELWRRVQSYYAASEAALGKKDDDRRLISGHSVLPRATTPGHWMPARPGSRRTIKRIAIWGLIVVGVYYFLHHLPSSLDFRDHGDRPPPYYPRDPGEYDYIKPIRVAPFAPSPPGRFDGAKADSGTASKDTAPVDRGYTGPVKFYSLARSLHAISSTWGSSQYNKNVLFAASSLKSAAALLPLACQMGMELRSYVHFALLSRSEIEIDDLRTVNGIPDECEIIFHDARPDYSSTSSDARLVHAVARAMYHINTYMHPQAVIIDGSSMEEDYFLKGIHQGIKEMQGALIELPAQAGQRFSWISKLDSASLSAWNKVDVDILIHASSSGSGGLIRLLKSLRRADLSTFTVPHLTIELPQRIEEATESFLSDFKWPPKDYDGPYTTQMLSLRHRIPRKKMTEAESSIRFLESFWPTDSVYSHVLVLSPQTEISPNFFHYLKYTLLEYRYSKAATLQDWDKRLFGISLNLPDTFLNATATFEPPKALGAEDDKGAKAPRGTATSFLWQAPNSNAILFLGQKWMEMHGFVSSSLQAQQNAAAKVSQLPADKSVSTNFPAWLEYALQLSCARGYFTHYPSPVTAEAVATVHRDLYQPPEEYDTESRSRPAGEGGARRETALTSGGLLGMLPDKGSLAPFSGMPLLSWGGDTVSLKEMDERSRRFTLDFRREVGGCTRPEQLESVKMDHLARDLFCDGR